MLLCTHAALEEMKKKKKNCEYMMHSYKLLMRAITQRAVINRRSVLFIVVSNIFTFVVCGVAVAQQAVQHWLLAWLTPPHRCTMFWHSKALGEGKYFVQCFLCFFLCTQQDSFAGSARKAKNINFCEHYVSEFWLFSRCT